MRLEGGCNFRQVSGYVGHAGRTVRPGRLYRSGVLAYFSAADDEQLVKLGIRAIVDLRSADERRREPTRWCSSDVTVLEGDEQSSSASLLRIAMRSAQTQLSMRQVMISVYCAIPEALASRLRTVFEYMERGEVPLLIHCSAGKDRTGFTVAMILQALGVDRQIILQDYLHTNQAVDLQQFVLEHYRPNSPRAQAAGHPLKAMDPDAVRALLTADADYLSAAFSQLEQCYGSLDGYLQQRVGIEPDMLTRIRDAMLL